MTLQAQTTGGMLRAKIRPRTNWLILLSSLLVLFILGGVGLIPSWELLQAALKTGSGISESVFKVLIFVALVVANIYAALRMLFYTELIIVNDTALAIQKCLLGISFSERTFPNSTIENLRYDEWSGGRAGTQNAIRFECAGETVSFARQATDSDSWNLIDKMCEIYKFPTKEDATGPERNPAVTNW